MFVGIFASGCDNGAPDSTGQQTAKTAQQEIAATPPKIAQADKDRVAVLMPLLQKHLPGLAKYEDSLTLEEVYPMLYYPPPGSGLPEEMSVEWVIYRVAEDGGGIPTKYRAAGHKLFVGVEESGRALILKKDQTKSVMLDRLVQSTDGKDMVIGL